MYFLFTIAGEGSRFAKTKWGNVAKPLIKVKGREMFLWAFESLPIGPNDTIIIISQKKHGIKEKLFKKISSAYPKTQIFWEEIGAITRGQLETALIADKFIDREEPVAIYNCDTYFKASHIEQIMRQDKPDGIIPCAQGKGDCWSFVRCDDSNRIVEVAEKKRISEWVSVGLYYFNSFNLFKSYAAPYIKNEAGIKEFYVAPLYNLLIRDGLKVLMAPVELFMPMGSPEQLQEFWQIKIKHKQ